jgi:hypothetical protein
MRQSMYAALSSSGVVKIGRSRFPDVRKKQIARIFARDFGSDIAAFEVCGWVLDFPVRTEETCLTCVRLELNPSVVRREWLLNVDFAAVVGIVRRETEAESELEPARRERLQRWLMRQMREEAFAA